MAVQEILFLMHVIAGCLWKLRRVMACHGVRRIVLRSYMVAVKLQFGDAKMIQREESEVLTVPRRDIPISAWLCLASVFLVSALGTYVRYEPSSLPETGNHLFVNGL